MIEVTIDAVAAGGDGIGRLDGKAVFVAGAVPGDVVTADVVVDKPRFTRARLDDLITPSPLRRSMPCPHAAECGGCSWQMVERTVQAGWKQEAVVAALARIGRFDQVTVRPILTPGPEFGYRNRLDLHPSPGGPGFHRAGSHDVVAIGLCLLAAPAVAALVDEVVGRAGEGDLTLRAGTRTGEAVIIGPGHAAPGEAVITEIVDGVRFQVSGRAFFQPNTDGAETLVELVRQAAGEPGGVLVDAYAGVGLFSATVGEPFERVVAIESSRRAVGDLRRNVPTAEVLALPAHLGLPRLDGDVDVAVVDPPRDGMDGAALAALIAARPRVVVSVSCDVATFARDARLMADSGYELEWVQPVDQFPHTPHVETVARLVRQDT
ncbi:MAG TPA: TRAM domain-containing protein [Acidimicrobiia bacterium]|nr:TRAM domain-containing protein [Acidimicrobiia bacterium]